MTANAGHILHFPERERVLLKALQVKHQNHMTEQQLQELVEKASNGTISPEEELELLKQLNNGADALQNFISKIKELDAQSSNSNQ